MRAVLGEATAAATLDSGLQRYLLAGLTIESDGAIVSNATASGAHAARTRFGDLVDYEAFANKIHIDEWITDAARLELADSLSQALALADRLGEMATARGMSIVVVISADPVSNDVVFRFHGLRANELPWYSDDLEATEQPILIRTDSTNP